MYNIKAPYGLTRREEIFCRQYVIDFNASLAARQAGYAKDTAGAIACNLLKKINVIQYVGELLQGLHERLNLSGEEAINEINRIASADRRNLFDEEGHLKPPNEIDDETAKIIEAIEITDKGGIKIKTASRMRALELILERHGMLQKFLNVTANVQTTSYEPKDAAEAAKLYQQFMAGT